MSSPSQQSVSETPDDPVSPELALVDLELRKRLAMQDDEVGAAPQPSIRSSSRREAGLIEAQRAHRRARVVVAFVAAALTVVGVAVAVARTHGRAPARSPTGSTAASVSSSTTVTTPAASGKKTLNAPDGPSGRDFAWAPVNGATTYEVAILRNGTVVFSATTTAARVHVPAHWERGGRALTLSAGNYHWYVWPILRQGSHTTRGSAVVATTFKISPHK